MTKTEKKKIFFSIIGPYFHDIGFNNFLDGDDPSLIYRNGNIVVHFFFNFLKNETIVSSQLMITNYEVEDFILLTGIPSNSLSEHKKKGKYHLPTVDLRRKPEYFKKNVLITNLEIQEYAKEFIKFYENEGVIFIKKYSEIPNILQKMDRLQSEGKYWNEILSGGPEHLVKGLIISKLCNDPDYFNKYNWVNPLLSSIEDWLPYWEKYKVVLEGIKPVYNLEN